MVRPGGVCGEREHTYLRVHLQGCLWPSRMYFKQCLSAVSLGQFCGKIVVAWARTISLAELLFLGIDPMEP